MAQSRALVLAVISLALVSCSDGAHELLTPTSDGPAFLISDAAHAPGLAGFYFRPPLVPDASPFPGTFDPGLSPLARVCQLSASMPYTCTATTIATFSSGSGPASLSVDTKDESYNALWHTPKNLTLGKNIYRLEVFVGSIRLGFLDFWFVRNAKELQDAKKQGDASQYVIAIGGNPVPIKFRIETRTVGQVAVSPATAAIGPGSQLFTATVTNLHGSAMSGVTVDWSSSNTAVATVSPTTGTTNGSGQATTTATAVGDGTTTITAEAGGVQGTATLSVTLDQPPVAVNDAATVLEDAAATTIDVLANDTDPDGGPKSIASVTQPANGTVVITNSGANLTYQPNADYCNDPPGTMLDAFTYTLTPGSSTATVTVTVTCVDDAPVAVDDATTVLEDAPATTIDVLANDTDVDGGPKSIASVTQPANGTVVITNSGADLTYQPSADYCNNPPGTTPDTFTYTLAPGGSTATVSVTVTCVEDPPTAVDDAATVLEDAPATTIDVLANDTDPDGGPKSIASVTQPANGTVVITNSGADLTYQPNADYCNDPPGTTPDTFTYTLTPGGSTATVSVTVTCVDDPPVAVADAATILEDASATTIDVLANDTDPDGGPKSILSVTQPANGTVVITNGGADLTYQPNANYCNSLNAAPSDNFTYTLTPGGSSTTVTVTVTCVNDAPVAQTKTAAAQANMKILGVTPGLLTGVTDPDAGISGCAPTFAIASITSNTGGTVSNVNLAAGSFDFDPAPGFTGTAVVDYTVSDDGCPGSATSAAAAINITVSGPVIWFVDPSVAGPGDGRLSNPFKFLSGNPGADNDADDVDAANHRIFLYSGTFATGIALNTGEWLIGQGVTDTNFDDVMGITPPAGTIARPPIGGALPTIQGTVTVNTQSATSVVRVLGFNLSTGASTALTNSGTTINGVTVNVGSVTTTTGNALAISGINNGSTAANAFTLANITVSGAAAAPVSVANFSGTLAVPGATNIQQRAGTGILLNNLSGTVTFGATTVSNPTDAGGYGIRVQNSSAPVSFASATISNANVVTPQADADNNGIPDNDGDGDAIFLKDNTGSFTLNGGTLSMCGNDCIDVRNSSMLVLSGVSITTPGQDVTGATGAGHGGHNISAINLTGTSSISGATISAFNVPNRDGLYLINGGTTALNLTITGSMFQNSTGNRGVGILAHESANMTVTIGGVTNNPATNNTFQNISGTAVQGAAAGSSTLNLTVQRSTFQNAPTDGKTNLIGANVDGGHATFTIRNNTFNNVMITASTGEALINLSGDGTAAGNTFAATVQNNTISNVGSSATTCAGGGVPCRGPINAVLVFIDDATNVPGTVVIEGNVLTSVRQGGIFLDLANTGAASSAVSAKIINNTVGTDGARVGIDAGGTVLSGIRVERRRNNSFSGNVLVANNSVRNGHGGGGSTLNGPGIFARTKANSNLSITLTGNSVDTNLTGGVAEMRFDTNANEAGDIVAPEQCVDVSGNTFPAGGSAVIVFNEINGTHNVEQASAAAVSAANDGATVTAGAGVSFGVACADPPALMAGGGGRPELETADHLDAAALARVGAAAIARVAQHVSPAERARLGAVTFETAPLPYGRLAMADGTRIVVSPTAAGWGWFVDSTPDDDEEFEPACIRTGLVGTWCSPVGDRMDLLTALMHEIGHVLGEEHRDAEDRGHLMTPTLSPGERRAPRLHAGDRAFASGAAGLPAHRGPPGAPQRASSR